MSRRRGVAATRFVDGQQCGHSTGFRSAEDVWFDPGWTFQTRFGLSERFASCGNAVDVTSRLFRICCQAWALSGVKACNGEQGSSMMFGADDCGVGIARLRCCFECSYGICGRVLSFERHWI